MSKKKILGIELEGAHNGFGKPAVASSRNVEGAGKFSRLTGESTGKHLAVLLD